MKLEFTSLFIKEIGLICFEVNENNEQKKTKLISFAFF